MNNFLMKATEARKFWGRENFLKSELKW